VTAALMLWLFGMLAVSGGEYSRHGPGGKMILLSGTVILIVAFAWHTHWGYWLALHSQDDEDA
jgi:hypothetical protein